MKAVGISGKIVEADVKISLGQGKKGGETGDG